MVKRLIAIVSLLVSTSAAGYVRTRTERGGTPVRWPIECIVMTADGRGSPGLTLDEIDGALSRSAGNWSHVTGSCGLVALSTVASHGPADVAPDGRPVVVFRNDVWQRPGAKLPYDPAILGLTTVFYVDAPGSLSDGQILDADIELNAVNFTFALIPSPTGARPGTTLADLENTLTHELGHVQGLAHTCWDHLTDRPPLNDQGQPIPDCSGPLPEAITSSTMYPFSLSPGETIKRRPTADDVRGICQSYPRGGNPAACFAEVDGGCTAVTGRRGSNSDKQRAMPIVGTLLLLAVLHERSRRCLR